MNERGIPHNSERKQRPMGLLLTNQTSSIQREVTESNTPKGLFNGQVVKTSFRLVMTVKVFLVHSDMLKGQSQLKQKHRL